MRVDEHIYQGFFGIKRKVDSYKYYHERVDKLKGLDNNLDTCITEFQKIIVNHDKKLGAYFKFLNKMNNENLNDLRKEIQLLEGMFDPDEISNDKEKRYLVKSIEVVEKLSKNEENAELNTLEKEVLEDLKSLKFLLESISPLWSAQLEFVKKNDEEIMNEKSNVKVLSSILKEEGDILKMEEQLLKKIDVKTGNILRRTTLKMRDTEKTKEMNIQYRDIKHIR